MRQFLGFSKGARLIVLLCLPALSQAQPSLLSDSVAFSIVLEHAQQRFKGKSWYVAVKPFALESPNPFEEGSVPVENASEYVAARRKHLTSVGKVGVETVSTRDCLGALVVVTSASDRKGCSKQDSLVVSVGLVRKGGASHSLIETEPTLGLDNYRTVRMIVTLFGPFGSSSSSYDIVMKWVDGRWQFLRSEKLLIVD